MGSETRTWPFAGHPAQQFRKDRRFYLVYDATYAAFSILAMATLLAFHWRGAVGGPTLAWIALFPVTLYGLIVAHLSIHNAVHGSFPKSVNRLIGELLGFAIAVRFASWAIVHLRHHRFTDDREKDPHPNFASFWATAKHTVVNVERMLCAEYYDVWGDTPENRAREGIRMKVSYASFLLAIAFWAVFWGPWFMFLVYFPANLLAGLFVIHFNWSTHNGGKGGDFRPVNLNHGYYWLGNKLFVGIYMHKNHHERPHLWNPAWWDDTRLGPQEQCVDLRLAATRPESAGG